MINVLSVRLSVRSTTGCKTHTVREVVEMLPCALSVARARGGCETRGPSGGAQQQLVRCRARNDLSISTRSHLYSYSSLINIKQTA